MQNIQILPPLRLFPKGIPTRAPPEARVEASCPLFDAGVIAGVEIFDDGDVGCGAGLDECYVRGGNVALEADFEGAIGVSGGIPGLVGVVEAVV